MAETVSSFSLVRPLTADRGPATPRAPDAGLGLQKQAVQWNLKCCFGAYLF